MAYLNDDPQDPKDFIEMIEKEKAMEEQKIKTARRIGIWGCILWLITNCLAQAFSLIYGYQNMPSYANKLILITGFVGTLMIVYGVAVIIFYENKKDNSPL